MQRLASDGGHASRLVLLTSLVVGVLLGSNPPAGYPWCVLRSDSITRGNKKAFFLDPALSERRKRARAWMGEATQC